MGVTRQAPLAGVIGGAAYRRRTDDLRITRATTLERCLVLGVRGCGQARCLSEPSSRFGLALQVSGAGLAHYSLGL
jgi:hypothetical protein